MRLLYANDRPGEYPPSWYAATADPIPPFPELRGEIQTDICVVGGGFTGLSTALHLRTLGHDVALVEAHRVGFGASGRNGGQVGSGLRMEQDDIVQRLGLEDARKVWAITEDAKATVRTLVAEHAPEARWRDGIAWVNWSKRDTVAEQDYAQYLTDTFGAEDLHPLSREATRALIGSEAFHGGIIDWSAGHIHPMRFALGLARACAEAGVQIFERSAAFDIRGLVRTDHGRIKAEHIVLATNGYHDRLHPKVSARALPINNFILATEPLGDLAQEILSQDIAVADSKFVVNYWRLTEDKRLLFGGCESYGDRFPKDIAGMVRKPMLEIYPQLKHTRIDYAWGGTIAVTPTRVPDFARLSPNLWSVAGYSGHGVALATQAGKLIAQAISGEAEGFDLMARLRPPAFPGVGLLRRPLLNLAMRWFALRDRFGV